VHAQFGHGAVDGLPVAEVSFLHRYDPRGDAQSCAAVPQALEPASEEFGLDDFDQPGIVSTWIRTAGEIARFSGDAAEALAEPHPRSSIMRPPSPAWRTGSR
jgi:hypothetical protein